MDAAATMIQTFVSSRLDYCNAVLNSIIENLFQRLQSVYAERGSHANRTA